VITASTQTTVGDLVRLRPSFSRELEHLKIDYCCGGKVSLAQACEKRGLDANAVLATFENTGTAEATHDAPDAMDLGTLADHIERTHHAYLREELPRLDALTRKVSAVHGHSEPRLNEVHDCFVACREELEAHMLKEEEGLFPMIRALEGSNGAPCVSPNTLASEIETLEQEHDDAGGALTRIRELTDDYTPPDWACNTYRAMLDGLETLERDMHVHVHKENSILFPKALALEASA